MITYHQRHTHNTPRESNQSKHAQHPSRRKRRQIPLYMYAIYDMVQKPLYPRHHPKHLTDCKTTNNNPTIRYDTGWSNNAYLTPGASVAPGARVAPGASVPGGVGDGVSTASKVHSRLGSERMCVFPVPFPMSATKKLARLPEKLSTLSPHPCVALAAPRGKRKLQGEDRWGERVFFSESSTCFFLFCQFD